MGGGPNDTAKRPEDDAGRPMHRRDDDVTVPGDRPMTEDEKLDEALQETFPSSDPIAPSRIDGPHG